MFGFTGARTLVCSSLVLPIFSTPAAASQSPCGSDCPDVGRKHVAGPEDDIQHQDCATLDFSFHVRIEASGSISVVSAGAEGAVEVSYESPDECETSRVSYDGDIHECDPGQSGQCCDPRAYQVNVSKYENLNPCPSNNIFALIRAFVTSGGELPSCAELAEVDLGANSVRWSAKAFKCEDQSSVPPYEDSFGEGSVVEGASTTFLLTLAPPQLTTPTTPLTGFEWLSSYLQTGSTEDIPEPMRSVASSSGPMERFSGLSVSATYTFLDVPGHGQVVNQYSARGGFNRDGTFKLALPGSGVDEDGNRVNYTENWARKEDALYLQVTGNPQSLVFPVEGGFADSKQAHRLPFVGRVTRWLDNPFRISACAAAQFSSEVAAGVVETTMSFAGDAPAIGTTKVWWTRADTTTDRPFRSRTYDLSGQLIEEVDYLDYRLVAPGIWRPTSIKETHFHPGTGAPFKLVQLQFSGYEEDPQGLEIQTDPVAPPDGRWFVQLP